MTCNDIWLFGPSRDLRVQIGATRLEPGGSLNVCLAKNRADPSDGCAQISFDMCDLDRGVPKAYTVQGCECVSKCEKKSRLTLSILLSFVLLGQENIPNLPPMLSAFPPVWGGGPSQESYRDQVG